MPTNIQKNFKKQMREFQKRQKNKGDEGFYSYIERDYINNYYENKKRKRKFAISGAGIISLLILGWNIYAGSTWLNHIVIYPHFLTIPGSTPALAPEPEP